MLISTRKPLHGSFPRKRKGFRDTIRLLSRNLSIHRKRTPSQQKQIPEEDKMPRRFYERRGAVQLKSYGSDYTIRNGNWILWVDTLSEEELSEIKEVFAMFDKDKSGSVNLKELGCILRTLGQMPTEDELTEFFHEADTDNSGTVEFPEFVTLVARQRCDPKEEMRLAFEAFDENGDKLISRDELRKFLSNAGEVFDECEFEKIMDEIDCDGDGFINYEEFVNMIVYDIQFL